MIAGPSWFDWAVHEPYFWAGERLVKAGIPIAKRMIRPRPAANWLARLNAALVRDGLVRVRAHARLPPQVTLDPLGLDTTTLDALVAVHRASLEGPNDVVTVLCQEPTWNDTPIRIRAAPLEYAAVCALDSLGKRPVMLSGNALLVCAETREILLHRRSDSSRDYARALHTFGGACIAASNKRSIDDRGNLLLTAAREVHEETGLIVSIPTSVPLIVCEEVSIGFISLAALGVELPAEELHRAEGNFEGDTVRVGFDELHRSLLDDYWVPAGRAQVLSWLALDAPVGATRARFRKMSGAKLFGQFVE